jgi:hypothetical protein
MAEGQMTNAGMPAPGFLAFVILGIRHSWHSSFLAFVILGIRHSWHSSFLAFVILGIRHSRRAFPGGTNLMFLDN